MILHQGLQQPLYLEVKSDLLVMSKISQVKILKSGGCGEQSYRRILVILSVASKCEHEKKTCSNNCQTWCVLPLNIWSLTAVKCRAKCKLFVCFGSAHFAHISFFLTFRHISRSETAHLPPEIILNVQKFLQRIFCWAKTNQVDNSHQLQTSNVWQQNIDIYTQSQHVFSSCVHA